MRSKLWVPGPQLGHSEMKVKARPKMAYQEINPLVKKNTYLDKIEFNEKKYKHPGPVSYETKAWKKQSKIRECLPKVTVSSERLDAFIGSNNLPPTHYDPPSLALVKPRVQGLATSKQHRHLIPPKPFINN